MGIESSLILKGLESWTALTFTVQASGTALTLEGRETLMALTCDGNASEQH